MEGVRLGSNVLRLFIGFFGLRNPTAAPARRWHNAFTRRGLLPPRKLTSERSPQRLRYGRRFCLEKPVHPKPQNLLRGAGPVFEKTSNDPLTLMSDAAALPAAARPARSRR